MKLSIVIVSWNVKDDLLGCLASLKENPPSVPFEQIVIDNMSADGTADAVKENYPEVTIIGNSDNRGFAAANNQGIELSRGQYILLLNPDTIVHPNSLNILVEYLDDNRDVGTCGPKLLNADGSTQASVRRFPTFRGVFHRHTVCRFLGLFRSEYREWMMKDFGYERQADVDQVMGAAMLVRRSVIEEVGAMDADFFMYYEEVDWCYRIKQAGWRIVFVPDAVLTHLGGRSSEQVPFKGVMMLKSMAVFFRKHRGRYAASLFIIVFKAAVILRNICHLIIGSVTYIFAGAVSDQEKKKKAIKKINLHSLLLSKYLWRIITL